MVRKHREKLVLVTDSYVRPKVAVPVVFQIEPPLRAIPSVIALGTVAIGESRTERVQFVSRCGEPLAVQIENHPAECSVAIDQHNPAEMIVAIKLKEPGIWQGVIKAKVKAHSEEQIIEIRCLRPETL